MKQPKIKVVRRTITVPKEIDNILTKQAIKRRLKTPSYYSKLLCEFAEPDESGIRG